MHLVNTPISPDFTETLPGLLTSVRELALEAGDIALSFFRSGHQTSAAIHYKDGGSPVTDADFAVDRFLKEKLRALAPSFGWLSEETEDDPIRLKSRHVWIVDPIDGTRSFAKGDQDWTIAIGVVDQGRPVLGVVHAPVTRETFDAGSGLGARLNSVVIKVTQTAEIRNARIGGPRRMIDLLHESHGPFERASRIHSLAYRMAWVADGGIDGGIANAGAHDWDIAAAHAILNEAGGELFSVGGIVPSYNKPSTIHGMIAAGHKPLAHKLTVALSVSSETAAKVF
jgi:myo-inositol-1(or 4)-monophosphatase